MKANRIFSKYKTAHTYKSSIFIPLAFIFAGFILLYLMIIYIASPYWHSSEFIKKLQQNNMMQLKQDIPAPLMLPMQTNILAAQHAPQLWQGAGATYLKQVWPVVAKNQDPYKVLLLQFNSAPTDTIHRSYVKFPNTFKLAQGNADNKIEFEWKRQSWRTWQLDKLCFYSPQPFDDTKHCASSRR